MTTHTGTEQIPIRRALVSVYDKSGLEELVRGLHDAGVALVSTGGSAALIEGLGIPVTKVEDLTGFPECLDGRVKTLHPRVHAGHPRRPAPREPRPAARRARGRAVRPGGLQPLPVHRDGDSGAAPDECVEQIDIGGPSMVRAAAKNHPSVAIVTSPERYADVLAAVGGRRLHARRAAAAGRGGVRPHRDVRRRTWRPGWATCSPTPPRAPASRPGSARPGTRPRCSATARTRTSRPRSTAPASGPAAWPRPSSCTARRCPTTTTSTPTPPGRPPRRSTAPAVAIIKHANPCGIAVGADVADAHRRAHACDPTSAFGGVIAVNRPVSVAMAEQVAEVFTEVIVAPAYDDGAVEVLARQEEHPDPGLPARRGGGSETPGDQRRAADAAPRPGRRPR